MFILLAANGGPLFSGGPMPSSTVRATPPGIPPEHRLLGMDRRTFPLALFVVAIFLASTVLIPQVDAAIEWDDPVAAGDQIALSETITFVPTTGWNVEEGFRVGQGSASSDGGAAVLAGEGITFSIVPGSFEGTPSELLEQVEKVTSRTRDPTFQASGSSTTITTTAGDAGVLQPYSSIKGDGIIAAFVIDDTGLKVTAYGPPTQMRSAAPDVRAMIASIRSTDSAADRSAS